MNHHRISRSFRCLAPLRLCVASFCFLLPLLRSSQASAVGAWTPLARNAPAGVELMILLSDGTVMCANQGGSIGRAWYKLTPDNHGSYVNGTWTTLASTASTRLYY